MTKSVLLADDSATMQQVAEITFRVSPYRLQGARSVDEALSRARAARPDLILADAVMAHGKTGYDLCLAIKSDPALASVPVIILFGNSQPYDEARGRQVGADGAIGKPWDTDALIAKVGELLDKASSGGLARPTGGFAQAAPAPAPAAAPPAPMPSAARTMIGGVAPMPPARPAPAPAPAPPPIAAPPPVYAAPAPHPAPTPFAAPAPAAAPSMLGGLPPPPAGLSRPPMIRAVPTRQPRPSGGPAVAPVPSRPASAAPAPMAQSGSGGAAKPQPPRSPTIMGMPSLSMPPGKNAPVAPMAAPYSEPARQAPPPAAAAARPATVPSAPAPATGPTRPIATPLPPSVVAPPAAAPRSLVEPMVARTAQAAAAAAPAVAAAAARATGLDPSGPEMAALLKLTRDVIEQVVWEIVPDLAETIIRENLPQLTAKVR